MTSIDFDRLEVNPGDGSFAITITARLLALVSDSLGSAEDLILTITNGYLDSGDGILYISTAQEDDIGTIETKYIVTRGGIVER